MHTELVLLLSQQIYTETENHQMLWFGDITTNGSFKELGSDLCGLNMLLDEYKVDH